MLIVFDLLALRSDSLPQHVESHSPLTMAVRVARSYIRGSTPSPKAEPFSTITDPQSLSSASLKPSSKSLLKRSSSPV